MVGLQAGRNRPLCQRTVGIVVMAIVVTAPACSRGTMPAPSPVQGLPQAAPPVASLPHEEKPSPVSYQSRGRRDPFRLPRVMTPEKPPTVNLTLTGIVREARSYYALVESDSSPGMGYIIHENDVVDSVKVVKITKESVIFEVHMKNSDGKLLTRYVEKHMPPVESR